MEIDQLISLAKKRRSIRKLKPDSIPDEYVQKIIEVARWAASAANTQPWEFIVVQDQGRKEQIAETFVQALDKRREKDSSFPFGPPGKAEKLQWNRYTQAPVLLIICCDMRLKEALPREEAEEMLHISMGAVLEHVHLAAAALGLGCAWGSVNGDVEDSLKKQLDIPASLRILEVFSLGYPDMEPIAKHCRDIEEMLHYGKFEPDKWRKDEEIKKLLANRKIPDIYSGLSNK